MESASSRADGKGDGLWVVVKNGERMTAPQPKELAEKAAIDLRKKLAESEGSAPSISVVQHILG